jgi:hypothetical protein
VCALSCSDVSTCTSNRPGRGWGEVQRSGQPAPPWQPCLLVQHPSCCICCCCHSVLLLLKLPHVSMATLFCQTPASLPSFLPSTTHPHCPPPPPAAAVYHLLQSAEARRDASLRSYVQAQLEYGKLWRLLEFGEKLDKLLQVGGLGGFWGISCTRCGWGGGGGGGGGLGCAWVCGCVNRGHCGCLSCCVPAAVQAQCCMWDGNRDRPAGGDTGDTRPS